MGSSQSCCGKYVCCGRDLESTSFQEFLDQADTGDIVLFNQNSMASQWKCFSRSEWNHVAIVINTPRRIKFLVEAVEPRVLAWKLEKAMESWLSPGECDRVVWRRLSGIERSKSLTRACFKFTMALQNRPFENNWMELVSAIMAQDAQRCCRKKTAKPKHVVGNPHVHQQADRETVQTANLNASNHQTEEAQAEHDKEELDMMKGIEPGSKLDNTTQALFCSELTAFYYQQAGWMSKEQLPCRFLPKDFADYRSANVPFYLNEGISLGPMIEIRPPEIVVLPPTLPTMGTAPSLDVSEQNPVHPPVSPPPPTKCDTYDPEAGTVIHGPVPSTKTKEDVEPDQVDHVAGF
eukprot:TRINITY_DN7989_c0_g1_i1.p1 TRINITY_DN7989_c0_g1~~TRINITY_DN7989_c0_g1_i1.p1  ORF type:complete len:349 (-),score=75.72 TRINITY_DN7989_c0_g1_i1:285-1331(-)